jgi:putative heme-binding domain-containing protein
MKDINEPSAAINPDHLAYSIKMKDGGLALGVVLEESAETLTIGQANGMNVVIPKDQIEQREALSTSLMPPALLNALSPTEHRDVMTFLLKRE